MAKDDRDRSFDKALAWRLRSAGHLGASDGKSSVAPAAENVQASKCLDAQILAAYYERSLTLDEMSVAKEHISGCPRCEEILAQLEATEKIPMTVDAAEQISAMQAPGTMAALRERTNAEKSGRILRLARMPRWRWVAPVGALAAGLLMYVAVREAKKTSSPPQIQVAKNQTAPTDQSPATNQSLQREPLSAYSAPSAPPSAKEPKTQNRETATRVDNFSKSKSAEKASAPNASAGNAANARSIPSEIKQLPMSPRGVSRPAQPERADAPASEDTDAVFSAAAAPPKSETPAAPPGSVGVLSEQTEVRGQSQALSAMHMAKAQESHLIVAPIVTPGGNTRWRVGPGGFIEQSKDGGHTWLPQSSGVQADLLAGSAPSAEVCWVAGSGGTILRTTDGGAHWEKIGAPVASDFASIRALDAMHATVRAASNGTNYVTSDGGATWTRLPNK